MRKLSDCGYKINGENSIKPNTGSETLAHRIAKMTVAHVLWDIGYQIESEAHNRVRNAYADLLAYGCPGRKPIVVELETNLSEGKRRKYRELYGVPVTQEVFSFDVDSLPTDPHEQAEAIRQELGL